MLGIGMGIVGGLWEFDQKWNAGGVGGRGDMHERGDGGRTRMKWAVEEIAPWAWLPRSRV